MKYGRKGSGGVFVGRVKRGREARGGREERGGSVWALYRLAGSAVDTKHHLKPLFLFSSSVTAVPVAEPLRVAT